jgi:hypothetical protein
VKNTWKVLVVLFAVALAGLALWVVFLEQDGTLSAAREQKLRDLIASKDVVIYFNSGGWGNTPLEEATDFTPVLYGMRDTLARQGYSTAIIPFERTASGFSGKIIDIKDFLVSFKYSGAALANEVKFIDVNFPGKKVIILGLSNGGALTERAMQETLDISSVYAIVAGVPKWYQSYSSDRILILTNSGMDQYSAGNIGSLAVAVIKAPFKWLHAKIEQRSLNFARAIEIPGHEYPWTSDEVGAPVVNFIVSRFELRVP